MEVQETFDVPILLIMFNRPAQSLKVFERIREVKPKSLYLAVDGPRPNRQGEMLEVQRCREIKKLVDWPCKIYTLFRGLNLGCKVAVSSAISWFFENVEAGIILEDDCLPDFTFFGYCRLLLDKYSNEDRVMHISGANLYSGQEWDTNSYFFSRIPHIWGWATWRRAWNAYDVAMSDYPQQKKNHFIKRIVDNYFSRAYWRMAFDETYSGKMNTWDYQWVYTIWKSNGFCITPNQNLISNIGFGEGATHTTTSTPFANLPTVSIEVNAMSHPDNLIINTEAEQYAFTKLYRLHSWWQIGSVTIKGLIKSLLNLVG